MKDASRARAAPGAGAAASERATARAAEEEVGGEEFDDLDCPPRALLLLPLLLSFAFRPFPPPSATPSPSIGRDDMPDSVLRGAGRPKVRARALEGQCLRRRREKPGTSASFFGAAWMCSSQPNAVFKSPPLFPFHAREQACLLSACEQQRGGQSPLLLPSQASPTQKKENKPIFDAPEKSR